MTAWSELTPDAQRVHWQALSPAEKAERERWASLGKGGQLFYAVASIAGPVLAVALMMCGMGSK